jgi:DNA primase small subunit
LWSENGYFERREFSFTLAGDIYVRYQSFGDSLEMERAIVSRCPEKIDIGAVYNIRPKESKSVGLVAFKAEHRELVFDIDMTDYDDVRTCCKGADICPKCWPFMIIAAKILNRALREDFGFQHLLWVYSGRRGIHCWVADRRARKLGGDARAAIVEYLSVIEGGGFKDKKVSFDGTHSLHPSIVSALKTIDRYFDSVVLDKQKPLETPQQINAIVDLCQDSALKEQLKTALLNPKLKDSTDRWDQLVTICGGYFDKLSKLKAFTKLRNRHFVDELKLQLCYPRLDINVTKGLNHLLKTPFSVHPKTGRICVPIDFNEMDSFDPFKVPNISSLCHQIDDKSRSDAPNERSYEKTDLHKSVKIFQNFIQNIEKEIKLLKIKDSDDKMDF